MSPRSLLVIALLGAGAFATGCGDETPTSTSDRPNTEPPPAGPIALASCGMGSRVTSNGTSCVAVGPTEIPEGFERNPDDWGFKAINPFGACPERFFLKIGRRDCEAIDHPCPTTFAPPGAALVHDQTELTEALAAAKPGATIALTDGTYGPIVVDRDIKLIGRCPEKTVVRANPASGRAIEVRGAFNVSIRSLAVVESGFGIWASDNAKVSITTSLFSGNGGAAWIQAGAELTLTHSLVRADKERMADGVLVARGGHAVLEDVELKDMHVALQAFGAGSTAKATYIVASDKSPEPMAALVVASHGGDVVVDKSLLFAQKIFLGGAADKDDRETGSLPAKLRVTNSELYRVLPTDAGGFDVNGASTLELVNDTFQTRARVGISAEFGAKISLERTVMRPVLPTDPADGGVGAGLIINDGTQLSIDRSAIVGMLQSGIMASRECHIRMTGSLVSNIWEFERNDFGTRFKSGQAISLSGNATLDLDDSTLSDNAGASIWTDRGGQTNVKVQRSAIIVTREPERTTAAAGIVAWGGTVDVRDSLVHGIPGTALALGEVTGAVSRTTISKDEIGFRLLGQSRTVASASPDRRPEPGEILTHENVVVETATVETEGELPLGDCRCADKSAR